MPKRKMSSSGNLPLVLRELRKLALHPIEGIDMVMDETDITNIQADIHGPQDTPYHGGVFRVRLVLPKDFPDTPPSCFFLTRIFHPNIAANGNVCVNTLKRDWKPTLGIAHIFQCVRCLLIIPFAESALNPDASTLFLESYDAYVKRAQLMCSIHAMPRCGAAAKAAGAEAATDELADRTEKADSAKDGSAGADASADKAVSAKDDSAAKRRNVSAKPKPALDKKKSERKRNLKRL